MKPSKINVILALLVSALLWSSSATVNKILLNNNLDPVTIVFFRLLIASIVILPFFIKEQKKIKHFDFTVMPIFLLSALNFLVFIIGLKLTNPNVPPILYTATPLIVALLANIFLKEKLTKRKILGIITGLIGTLIIIVIPVIRTNELVFGNLTGNIFVLIAVTCWAGFTVGSRYLSSKKNYSPIYIASLSFFTSTALFMIIVSMSGFSNLVTAFTFKNMALFLYLGVFVTVATFLLYQWAIKHSSANTASLMVYLQPPSAFLLSWIFLSTPLAWEFAIGTVVVFIGVFLATSDKITKRLQKEKEVEIVLEQER